jgi:TM2 domain-containing membrane protein YozV
MGIILTLFYGFIGLVVLFLIIAYAVSIGIDNSKQVKVLRSELKEIKKQLKDLGENVK